MSVPETSVEFHRCRHHRTNGRSIPGFRWESRGQNEPMSRAGDQAEHFRWQGGWCASARLSALCPPADAGRRRHRGGRAGAAGCSATGRRISGRRSGCGSWGRCTGSSSKGRRPTLAATYPSAGGKADPEAAWDGFHRRLVEERFADVEAGIDRRVQTNEVGRSTALVGGFLEVARAGPGCRCGSGGRRQRRAEPALGPLPVRGPGRDVGPGRLARAALLLQQRPAAAVRRRGHGGRAGRVRPRAGGRRHATRGASRSCPTCGPTRPTGSGCCGSRSGWRRGRSRARSTEANLVDWLPERMAAPARHGRRWSSTRSSCSTCRSKIAVASKRSAGRPGPEPTPEAPLAWLRLEPHKDQFEVRPHDVARRRSPSPRGHGDGPRPERPMAGNDERQRQAPERWQFGRLKRAFHTRSPEQACSVATFRARCPIAAAPRSSPPSAPPPRTSSVLTAMVAAGMDVARLSLAHGPLEETLDRLRRIRSVDPTIGILADLPGPKIRAGVFPEGGVHLTDGASLDLVPGVDGEGSTERRVRVDHPALLADLREGDHVRLGDGAIQLVVTNVDEDRARAQVKVGGWARGRPGVALPAGRLSMSSPTPQDLKLLEALADAGVDAVAISFVRTAADITRARAHLAGDGPMLVAKIETAEAVDAVEDIIATADGVMVARGDLGIRCALEDVPHHQKRIIKAGVAYGRPVITATQMLESMVVSSVPDPGRGLRRGQRRLRRVLRAHALGRDRHRRQPGRRHLDHGQGRRPRRGASSTTSAGAGTWAASSRPTSTAPPPPPASPPPSRPPRGGPPSTPKSSAIIACTASGRTARGRSPGSGRPCRSWPSPRRCGRRVNCAWPGASPRWWTNTAASTRRDRVVRRRGGRAAGRRQHRRRRGGGGRLAGRPRAGHRHPASGPCPLSDSEAEGEAPSTV